jgi:hypothetical protein
MRVQAAGEPFAWLEPVAIDRDVASAQGLGQSPAVDIASNGAGLHIIDGYVLHDGAFGRRV